MPEKLRDPKDAPQGPGGAAFSRGWALGVFFLAALAAFTLVDTALPAIYDNDSYYHLGVARIYLERGFAIDFPWTRFSVMRSGFGDKEFLFHVLLMPFAALRDPNAGGLLAVAILNAAIATAVASLAVAAVGAWGYAIPVLLFATSANFTIRLISLRPESLSLLLLLAGAAAAARRRGVLLGLIAAVYALSYTGFQALLILCVLWFLAGGWLQRRWEPRLLIWPLLGTAAGLLLHPQFPANLRVWFVQNVNYHQIRNSLDIGGEIFPATTAQVLRLNAGWLAGLLVLWNSSAPGPAAPPGDRSGETFGIAAACFAGLFLLGERFAVYAVPFVTLALLFRLRGQGLSIGRWTHLPGRGRAPLVLSLGLCLLTAPHAAGLVVDALDRGAVLVPNRMPELAEFSRAVPAGARVAAPWGETALYIFAAPQAAYLNVLEPAFLAVADPQVYRAQRALFEGLDPDPPLTAGTVLDSEYIAFSPINKGRGAIQERLAGDPRVQRLFGGYNYLYRIVPGANTAFVLDWEALSPDKDPGGAPPPWLPYPRLASAAARALEGYVDAGRISAAAGCVDFRHREFAAEPVRVLYEFAPSGPAAIWVDGKPLASQGDAQGARLGKGLRVQVPFPIGDHELLVRSCPAGGRSGFYLLERERFPLHAGEETRPYAR